ELVSDPELVIPHPEMHRRRFVLVPLVELNPRIIIPRWGEAEKILELCPDKGRVTLAHESDQW
ncbi:MAG: 2-amino-4-hydroxy-6-hydroxymethyldihydropteridine diphosphokinase, partial [Dehalobacterium sp.]